jgi:hypothetical protein
VPVFVDVKWHRDWNIYESLADGLDKKRMRKFQEGVVIRLDCLDYGRAPLTYRALGRTAGYVEPVVLQSCHFMWTV